MMERVCQLLNVLPRRAHRLFARVVILAALLLSSSSAFAITPSIDEAVARGLIYQMGPYPQTFGLLGYGAGFADLDADGDPDVIILGAGDDDAVGGYVGIFENDGTGNFTDRSQASGIPVLGDPAGFAAGDIDGDGLPELYFTQLRLPNVMVHNDGGFQFSDISATAGVDDDGPGQGASFGDFDGDSRLDLYLVNYNGQLPGTEEKDNKLYRNLGDGAFEDVSVAQTVDDHGNGFEAVWFDYDLDGDVDLYLSNDRGHRPPLFRSNQLWRNDDGQLVNASVGSGADGALFSMGIACADFDNNGRPDLYVTNVAAYDDGFNPLYLNSTDTPTFTESSALAGVEHWITSWGTIFYDFDNNGVNDLYVNNQFLPNSLYVCDGTFPCTEVGEAAGVVANNGVSYVSAIADVDDDGDMDLLTNNLNSNVQLFINYTDDESHWAKFRMVGLGDNAAAVGGRIVTQVGTRQQVNEVLAGGNGYLGQNDLILHVGLGEAVLVDQVNVSWPGGSPTRTLTALPADATWTLYPPSRLGDADGDGTVTLADFFAFAGCFTDGFDTGCEMMDFGGDSAIDMDDFDSFVAVYSEALGDCNENLTTDLREILLDPSLDQNGTGVPDSCEAQCGNGAVEAGEECDDGNSNSGDGCSMTCEFEPDSTTTTTSTTTSTTTTTLPSTTTTSTTTSTVPSTTTTSTTTSTTTTTTTSTTTTTTTTTTLPSVTCGDANDDHVVTASDALAVLRTAVNTFECPLCRCDVDGSGAVSASDALATLRRAVGQPAPLSCPSC